MLYNYECQCGCEFVSDQPMHRRQTAVCPTCGTRAKKIISLPAIRFRGADFSLATVDVDRERERMTASGELVLPDEHTREIAKHKESPLERHAKMTKLENERPINVSSV